MIEAIKARIWRQLAEKEVSLAMLLDREGRILWHRGRSVRGATIEEGDGFPKSSIRAAVAEGGVHQRDVVVVSSGARLPESARVLYVKSLLVLPIDGEVFLYVDSGSKTSFDESEIGVFRLLGELLRDGIEQIRRSSRERDGITGASPAMARVRELVLRYALEDEPVLLTGETGVGKNHVAERLHRYSGRRGRFVVAHIPSIPENLFESEMFGHARGAFTGAGERKTGLVSEAEGGTLVLDEVAEVPPSFQAKLLMLVETRRYRMLGETGERSADVRIIAACNRDLAVEVREKRFRADLFYRLGVLPIAIPPLRERVQDIRELVAEHLGELRGKLPGDGFWEAMLAHPWPGNVRELVSVLKRAGITLPGPTIGGEVGTLLAGGGVPPADSPSSCAAEVERALRSGASFWDTAWRAFLRRDLNRGELRALLRRIHAERGGNLRALSEALNIAPGDYARFISLLHKYGIHPGK